jgi:acetyl esterase/lipase
MLRYRLPGDSTAYRHPVPLLDAQRAIRLVRSRAAEWNIDPHKLALMGFSAGGHLASTVATHFDPGHPADADPVNRQSSRPDFVVLGYPVISLKDGITHSGSKANLLGPNPDLALVENLSNETQVISQTPPTLLVHAVDDSVVPIEHSHLMLAALREARVAAALHEYPNGEHGFGYDPADPNSKAPANWLDQVLAWLTSQGFTLPEE